MKQIDIALSKIEEIKSMYESGSSVWGIGKEIGLAGQTVHKAMVRAGIPRRDRSKANQKHTINENYFQDIDSHEKAYWLGVLFADGGLVRRPNGNYTIGLTLKSEDRYHLQSFLYSIEASHGIIDRKDKNASQFAIGNKKLCSDLMDHGLTIRKSFTNKYPVRVKAIYDNSFILGYFDGNGSLYSRKRRRYIRKQSTFSLVGSYSIIDAISEKIKSNTRITHLNVKKHSTSDVYMIRVEGIYNLESLMGWLYKDCTVYLKRKRKVYEEQIVNYRNDVSGYAGCIEKIQKGGLK